MEVLKGIAMNITEWKFVDITSKVRIMYVQYEVFREDC